MTTLTKEQIAEIEAAHTGELEELCRLALLGLRVEEAPKYVADRWPAEFGVEDGKRVALVVLP